jgi:hypothetical protein
MAGDEVGKAGHKAVERGNPTVTRSHVSAASSIARCKRKELWKCQGLNSFVYASALYADGVAAAMSGFNGSALAVKLGGSGDITKDRLWRHPRNNQRVGSGVLVGDYVDIVDENGAPHSYDVRTAGKPRSGLPRA